MLPIYKYKCWSPDDNETFDSGIIYESYGPNGAAEIFAGKRWGESAEIGVVHVTATQVDDEGTRISGDELYKVNVHPNHAFWAIKFDEEFTVT